ncbi:type II secretion system F family protein [Cellulomonas endophytica]|uniref:type II secretion system F family protein n=1 Tax=Cellulomonas endophytica TaxID=2494735 RepID=UPI0010139FB9|nr:type II secretion system F family protein [Cellulomonas endophytica]
MKSALAALTGAALVGGILLTVAGLLRTAVPPVDAPSWWRRRGTALPSSGWERWRWAAAAAAGVLAWALTSWPVAGLAVAAAVVGLPVLLGTGRVAAGRIDRIEAIEEWTRRLADVLSTGTGLEQALTTTARTSPAPIRPAVDALTARLAARWSTEAALRAFADDLDDPAGDFVTAALLLAARRRGPGLARALTSVAAAVAEDVAARRRIEAERAKPRTTARAVTLITLLVAGALMLNGTYLAPYGTGAGQLVLAAIAAGFTGCLLWIRHLTLATPDQRFLTPASARRGRLAFLRGRS